MVHRKRPWLHVRAFITSERIASSDPTHNTGPWDIQGVWHDYHLQNAFADLPGASPFVPIMLFVSLISRKKSRSRPRELEAHLYRSGDPSLICRYRFLPQSFSSGTMIYIALPLQPPPIADAGWYEFLLILDDAKRSVLTRSEVYLNP